MRVQISYETVFQKYGFNEERGEQFKNLLSDLVRKKYPEATVKVVYGDNVSIEVIDLNDRPETEHNILGIICDSSSIINYAEQEDENRRQFNKSTGRNHVQLLLTEMFYLCNEEYDAIAYYHTEEESFGVDKVPRNSKMDTANKIPVYRLTYDNPEVEDMLSQIKSWLFDDIDYDIEEEGIKEIENATSYPELVTAVNDYTDANLRDYETMYINNVSKVRDKLYENMENILKEE